MPRSQSLASAFQLVPRKRIDDVHWTIAGNTRFELRERSARMLVLFPTTLMWLLEQLVDSGVQCGVLCLDAEDREPPAPVCRPSDPIDLRANHPELVAWYVKHELDATFVPDAQAPSRLGSQALRHWALDAHRPYAYVHDDDHVYLANWPASTEMQLISAVIRTALCAASVFDDGDTVKELHKAAFSRGLTFEKLHDGAISVSRGAIMPLYATDVVDPTPFLRITCEHGVYSVDRW